MKEITDILAAMAAVPRFAALCLLADGKEHCVCEMMTITELSQSRMSRHMAALKDVGLVSARRDAQWVRYRLNPGMAANLRELVLAALVCGRTARGIRHGK